MVKKKEKRETVKQRKGPRRGGSYVQDSSGNLKPVGEKPSKPVEPQVEEGGNE